MTTQPDTLTPATGTGPEPSHSYCIRHDDTPLPSLCGQATLDPTRPITFHWPEDRPRCAVCEELENNPQPCPRCPGTGDTTP